MTPFKQGDVVIRTGGTCWGLVHGSSYIVHSDDPSNIGGNGSVRVYIKGKVSEDTFDRDYFKLETVNQSNTPFKAGDLVRHKDGIYKNGVVHSFIENGMLFYFEDKNKNKSIFRYKTHEFELIAECKDANSNNDGCIYIPTVSEIKPGDYVRRIGSSYLEVQEGYIYKVYEVDKENDLKLIINGEPSTYLYRSNLFAKESKIDFSNPTPIRLDLDAPKINGTSWPSRVVGDAPIDPSNYSNPIIPMSKTFNDYAVEAFMSNEENRIAATNAQHNLFNLIESLEQVQAAIDKVKTVISRDSRKLNEAMNDSNITVISALVAENPAVKEFVERFMENTLVQLVPEPVVTSNSVADKFK